MATHSSIFAWKIPWREEPGGLTSTGLRDMTKRLSMRTAASKTRCKSNFPQGTIPSPWYFSCFPCSVLFPTQSLCFHPKCSRNLTEENKMFYHAGFKAEFWIWPRESQTIESTCSYWSIWQTSMDLWYKDDVRNSRKGGRKEMKEGGRKKGGRMDLQSPMESDELSLFNDP